MLHSIRLSYSVAFIESNISPCTCRALPSTPQPFTASPATFGLPKSTCRPLTCSEAAQTFLRNRHILVGYHDDGLFGVDDLLLVVCGLWFHGCELLVGL